MASRYIQKNPYLENETYDLKIVTFRLAVSIVPPQPSRHSSQPFHISLKGPPVFVTSFWFSRRPDCAHFLPVVSKGAVPTSAPCHNVSQSPLPLGHAAPRYSAVRPAPGPGSGEEGAWEVGNQMHFCEMGCLRSTPPEAVATSHKEVSWTRSGP